MNLTAMLIQVLGYGQDDNSKSTFPQVWTVALSYLIVTLQFRDANVSTPNQFDFKV